jgi:hypothetical protein
MHKWHRVGILKRSNICIADFEGLPENTSEFKIPANFDKQ